MATMVNEVWECASPCQTQSARSYLLFDWTLIPAVTWTLCTAVQAALPRSVQKQDSAATCAIPDGQCARLSPSVAFHPGPAAHACCAITESCSFRDRSVVAPTCTCYLACFIKPSAVENYRAELLVVTANRLARNTFVLPVAACCRALQSASLE